MPSLVVAAYPVVWFDVGTGCCCSCSTAPSRSSGDGLRMCVGGGASAHAHDDFRFSERPTQCPGEKEGAERCAVPSIYVRYTMDCLLLSCCCISWSKSLPVALAFFVAYVDAYIRTHGLDPRKNPTHDPPRPTATSTGDGSSSVIANAVTLPRPSAPAPPRHAAGVKPGARILCPASDSCFDRRALGCVDTVGGRLDRTTRTTTTAPTTRPRPLS